LSRCAVADIEFLTAAVITSPARRRVAGTIGNNRPGGRVAAAGNVKGAESSGVIAIVDHRAYESLKVGDVNRIDGSPNTSAINKMARVVVAFKRKRATGAIALEVASASRPEPDYIRIASVRNGRAVGFDHASYGCDNRIRLFNASGST